MGFPFLNSAFGRVRSFLKSSLAIAVLKLVFSVSTKPSIW